MSPTKGLLCSLLLFVNGHAATEDPATWGKAADNKIHIQRLVNQVVVKNPDLFIIGVHAVPPGSKEQTMVACNLDRINKPDHLDDLEVTSEHRTSLNQKLAEPNKFTVMTPLKDAAGNVIGALVLIYGNFKPGETEEQYYLRSMKLRDDLAKEIADQSALFKRIDG